MDAFFGIKLLELQESIVARVSQQHLVDVDRAPADAAVLDISLRILLRVANDVVDSVTDYNNFDLPCCSVVCGILVEVGIGICITKGGIATVLIDDAT